MKKSLFLVLMIVLISMISVQGATYYGITEAANLKVTLVSQDPDPVEPGRFVEMRWKIENIGSGTASDVIIEVVPKYPFSIYSDDVARDIGTIQGRLTGDDAVIVHYKLKVDEKAAEGTNQIKVRYKYDQNDWTTLEPFDIRVETADAEVSIESLRVDPIMLYPGKNVKIDVGIKNLADSLIRNIKIKVDLSSDDLPFIPINTSTERIIERMNPDQEKEVSYTIKSSGSSTSQTYKIPLSITYSDESGNNYSKSEIIGIDIGATPELDVNLETSDILYPATKGEVSIKFVNKGVSDIKFLNIELEPSMDYKILSSEKDYLGNVDSDDYESADFRLYIESDVGNEIVLPINIEYKDSNNNEYKRQEQVHVKLYNMEEAETLGLQEKKNGKGIIIAIVVIVIGLITYKIVRSRKKKK